MPSSIEWTDETWNPERLDQPLHWKKPRRIFVNSMSDLFHEDVPDHFLHNVFATMALAPQHTFQVLTKRAKRMNEYCSDAQRTPFNNVHLGVSCEDQATADERIPVLLQTPAVARFISLELLLGPINVLPYLTPFGHLDRTYREQVAKGMFNGDQIDSLKKPTLSWVIVGGESGPRARPFDIQWARDIIAQCKATGVACFVKQLGSTDGFKQKRRKIK